MQTGAESHGEQAGRLHHVHAWVSMDAGRRAEGSCAEDGRRKVSRAPFASPIRSAAGPLPSAGLRSWPPAPLASRTQHHASCAKHRAPMKYQVCMYQARKTSIRYALYYSEDAKDYSDSDDARLKQRPTPHSPPVPLNAGPTNTGGVRVPRRRDWEADRLHLDSDQASGDFVDSRRTVANSRPFRVSRKAPPRFRPQF
ncbi:hypothetical protein B0H14DRAFT_1622299 [Mycena olivaceomarginata]|nr:hypothetical protein B0H14DRAFT_1622299 [Mycena olivaceomarginata]